MDKSFKTIKNNIDFQTKTSSSLICKVIRKIFNYDIVKLPYKTEMVTLEQLNNIEILLKQTIHLEVPGEIVELGSFTGTTAALIQETILKCESNKLLHVYDTFESLYHLKTTNTLNSFKQKFEENNIRLPEIHKGLFQNTVPRDLPNIISFAHIDCGTGVDSISHKELILHCLNHIYERMPKGSICVLMDYHDAQKTIKGFNNNKGVKLACDEFFEDKSEKMEIIFGGYFSHAYFLKS